MFFFVVSTLRLEDEKTYCDITWMIFSKFMSGKTFELKTFLLGFFILTLSKLLIFMTLINTKVTKSQYLTMYSSNWFGDRLHSILIFSEFKGATKLYFMHCSYVVIILFNTGLYKSGFATVFCLSALVFSACYVSNLRKLYNICIIIVQGLCVFNFIN